jgi:hypothetical protein
VLDDIDMSACSLVSVMSIVLRWKRRSIFCTLCAGSSSGGGLGLLVSQIRKDRKIDETRKERVIHKLP